MTLLRRLRDTLGGDGNGYSIGDGIVDRREVGAERDELLELFVADVGLDANLQADALVSFPDVWCKAQKATEVEIAFESGLNTLDGNATGGRVIHHRSSDTGGQGVQQVLDGIGAAIGPQQALRLVG
jgi:hypothetical protein